MIAQLAKLRLVSLVILTVAVGYVLGDSDTASGGGAFWWTISGTVLSAAGAMILNQVAESRLDSRMTRTSGRPVVSGAVAPTAAWSVGVVLITCGITMLGVLVNIAAAVLTGVVVGVYLGVYTPLKSRSSLCTLAGGICGALPPMIGYAASSGGISFEAYVLGALLFCWQIPHFLAIAWRHRSDYVAAGFAMLTNERSGILPGVMAVVYTLALLPFSMLAVLGVAWGNERRLADAASVISRGVDSTALLVSVTCAGICSVMLLGTAVWFGLRRSDRAARILFVASIVYLTCILAVLVVIRLYGKYIV